MFADANGAYQQDYLIMLKAAQEASALAMSYFKKDIKSWIKNKNSPVSEADIKIDNFLQQALLKQRPSYGWISEESAAKAPADAQGRSFVIDPIDGTRGFLAQKLSWSISLALIEEGRPVIGIIAAPARGELFSAYDKGGAYLNGQQLPPAQQSHAAHWRASVEYDFLHYLSKRWQTPLIKQEKVPSLAYCLMLIAKNELDFFLLTKNCFDWDIAAADIILQELGHHLRDIDGLPISYGRGNYRQKYLSLGPEKLQKDFRYLAKLYYNLL